MYLKFTGLEEKLTIDYAIDLWYQIRWNTHFYIVLSIGIFSERRIVCRDNKAVVLLIIDAFMITAVLCCILQASSRITDNYTVREDV